MSDVVNSVVNNLADRLGEVVEAVGPISQTMVQETAAVGFAYVVIGCGFIGAACIATLGIILAMKYVHIRGQREGVVGGLIMTAVIFVSIGLPISLVHIGHWLAPTKSVVIEMVKHLS